MANRINSLAHSAQLITGYFVLRDPKAVPRFSRRVMFNESHGQRICKWAVAADMPHPLNIPNLEESSRAHILLVDTELTRV